MKRQTKLLATLCVLTALGTSCKKETVNKTEQADKGKIIQINNNVNASRLDLSNAGLKLSFESPSVNSKTGQSTASAYPYELVYKGKVNPLKGVNNNDLSALEVSGWAGKFAIGYQTPGSEFGGGVDVIDLNAGVPQFMSSASMADADVTCVANGGGRLYIGMDMGNFEHYDFPAPAVLGVVKTNGGNLESPVTVGLEGYSTKDVKYNSNNDKVYAATSTQGGVSAISFQGNNATRTAYQPYGTARSIAFSDNNLYVTNGYSYSKFDANTLAMSNYTWWPIPSTPEPIGRMATLSNGNFVFGNSLTLAMVDKTNNNLLDQIDVGGIVNGVSIVNDKIYISTGNSLVVAKVSNSNTLEVIAKTHFSSAFGGNFNVIGSKVSGNYVLVACGVRGTYIFKLTASGV